MKQLKNFVLFASFLFLLAFAAAQENEDSTVAEETTEEVATEESASEASKSASGEKLSTKSEVTTANDDEEPEKQPKKDKKSEESCKPWPSTHKPLRECCLLPHNPLTITLNTCYYRCTAREMDERRQVECGASCFVNVTGIYYDHHLNKERLKNLMIGASIVPSKWIHVIENAVDSCRFDTHGSMHEGLARFFGCVNDFMTDNCMQFIQSIECEKSQDLFEQCHHIKPLCDHWPFGYGTLDACCKIPTLFSQELRTKCHHECTYSELFLQRQAKCDETCRYDDTKLRVANRFNFDAVRAMLMESAKHEKEWKGPIERAVEKCKNAMGTSINTRANSIEYEITTLQTCLREFLANECVDFKIEPICERVKTFTKYCPEIRPRKSSTLYSQHYGH